MRYLAAVLLVVLAACGLPAQTSPPSSSSSSASQSRTSSSSHAQPTPTPSAGELTLRGTVEPGVESGCLILVTGGQEYLLLGGDRNVVTAGADVVVQGVPRPGEQTTCQQGVPFEVKNAEPG
ncbi:hypothetical protein FKR81_19210 [Lentzea tibetensis]|uniref:Lipoprotein n=1 Tax=Lentzea tibetensis TaxID=2591470 RepID=A0A563ESU4_9PSEU|nr:hypothetical protein [Lentzea tibetensis]TWP50736.1 hypothetical protein FKR81_19210 [Lentzea tibetensis]